MSEICHVNNICAIFQEDIFIVKAVDLGNLVKVKIRHDNKGIGAAWFLDRIEVDDPKLKKT